MLSLSKTSTEVFEIAGFVTKKQPAESNLDGIDRFIEAEISPTFAKEAVLLNGIGSSVSAQSRFDTYSEIVGLGFRQTNVVAKSASLDEDLKLGLGIQIFQGSIIQTGTSVDDGVLVGSGAIVEHDVTLGKGAFVGPGAVILGGVVVEPFATVYAGAIILPGIRIGHGSVIGAGSVVRSDVTPDTLVAGNPAKIIRPRI